MFIRSWKKEIFTIPNLLSLFRLLLIPIYMYIYINAQSAADYYWAAAILALSCLTDLFDGKIARRFNMISNAGKLLDPIADKLTQLALIVCLAIRYPVINYLIVLFIIKESFMLVAFIVAFKYGKMLDGALFSGKICTTVLFISLIILVLIPTLSETVVTVITCIDALFLLIAFIDYARAYLGKNKKIYNYEFKQDE